MDADLRSCLPDDIVDAVTRFIEERYSDYNQAEAVAFILRQWLMHEGYLAKSTKMGTPPDELNATNDD